MDTLVFDFYTAKYPSDVCGLDLDRSKTFNDLYDALKAKEDVYAVIGIADSIVRERLFAELADLLNVKYDVIYDLWLERD